MTETKEPQEIDPTHAEDELVAADDAVIGKAFNLAVIIRIFQIGIEFR